MKKFFYCCISLALAISLCLSIAAPAFASVHFEKDREKCEYINTEKMLPILCNVAIDAESWGIEKQDFDSLYIGQPIQAYEYLHTGTLQRMDFVYYPIFSRNDILFLVLENEDGTFQVTQAFANILSQYLNEQIVFVYDINEIYITCANVEKTQVAYEFEATSENRGDISGVSEIPFSACCEFVSLAQHQAIPPLSQVAQPTYDPLNPPITLLVPQVLQQYAYTCWAASTASIGNYLTGKSYSDYDIAYAKFGLSYNQGATLTDSVDMLKRIYGIVYQNYEYTNPPTWARIYDNLSENYPLYGRWICEGYTHQTVIRGANRSTNYLSLMDPGQGLVSSYWANGVFTFRSVGGYTWTCIGYASKL